MKISFRSNRGFTLIEILVVIAILAIIAGIVVGFLVSSNKSATDVQIKSNLSDLRKEASLYFNDDSATGGQGTYHRVGVDRTNNPGCALVGSSYFISSANGTNASKILSQATNTFVRTCRNTIWKQEWLIAVDSSTNPGAQYFCSDSAGNVKSVSGDLSVSNGGLPSASPFICP